MRNNPEKRIDATGLWPTLAEVAHAVLVIAGGGAVIVGAIAAACLAWPVVIVCAVVGVAAGLSLLVWCLVKRGNRIAKKSDYFKTLGGPSNPDGGAQGIHGTNYPGFQKDVKKVGKITADAAGAEYGGMGLGGPTVAPLWKWFFDPLL